MWEHNLDLDVVVDYVNFLIDENDYTRGIEIGEKLYHRFKSLEKVNGSRWARFCGTLAILYRATNRLSEAEKLYLEALEIRRRLAEAHPEAYLSVYLSSCYNLAVLLSKDPLQFHRVKELYDIIFDNIYDLADAHPDVYDPQVAQYCYAYGLLCEQSGRFGRSADFFEEALDRALPYKDTDPTCRRIVKALS